MNVLPGRTGRAELTSLDVVASVTPAALAVNLAAAALAGQASPPGSWAANGWLVLLAICTPVLGTWLIVSSIARMASVTSSAILLLQPLLAFVWGAMFFDEVSATAQLAGFTLALAGIAVLAINPAGALRPAGTGRPGNQVVCGTLAAAAPPPAPTAARRGAARTRMAAADDEITLQGLNRALLARQQLLSRAARDPLDMVRSLVALQAQAVWAPYYALWSRIDGFDPTHLATALTDRRAVRSVSLRGTIHLVVADDAAPLFTFARTAIDRAVWSQPADRAALDPAAADAVARAAAQLLAGQPMTAAELTAALAPGWPGVPERVLWNVVRPRLVLIQVPPRAVWGRRGAARWTTFGGHGSLPPADDGADPTVDPTAEPTVHPTVDPAVDEAVVLRYLAAFGPATVADLQTWAGRTRLAPVVQRLGDRLVTLRGPGGTRYLDLPDAPRPADDTPAPPRLVGPFDNLLLGYRDRSRLMSDAARARFFAAPNGQLPGAVLVDGRIAGEWTIHAGPETEVRLTPYEPIGAATVDQLGAEARRLRAPQRPDAEPRLVVAGA
ncbi:MAG: crosslink repair DNA glycosylase YcaQ family protein [Acidimicrobiales bacterium]